MIQQVYSDILVMDPGLDFFPTSITHNTKVRQRCIS